VIDGYRVVLRPPMVRVRSFAVTPTSASLESGQPAGLPGLVAAALLWGIPVALLAAMLQGLVALFFDVGVLYPVIGCVLGSAVRIRSPRLNGRLRRLLAIALTYLAIALSPLIPFGRAVAFDPIRMRHTAVGLVLAFVPLMAKTGLVGLLNLALFLSGLRYAWVRSCRP
jgi:hypothetical protein